MKVSKLLIFVALFHLPVWVNAQTELEIKSTGKYLYSWALDISEIKARESAKLGLLDTIFVTLLKESSIDQTDTVFIKVIDYFVNKVGVKWQAIAFADKSNISVKLEQRQQLKVIPVIIGEQSETLPVKRTITGNEDSSNKIPVSDTEINTGILNNIKTGNLILDELLIQPDAQSLERQLKKFKSELKLNFGDKSNYPDDTGCYIFIIDGKTLKIIAVYDKGTGYRRNFLTNLTDNNLSDKYKENHFVYVVIK